MSEARRHIRNLMANWICVGGTLLTLFFLSPFVVHTLGKVEYGIWSLLTVLTGYMGIFDLGVRASTGRYVILYHGRQDHERVDETIRTSLTFFSLAGLLVVAAGFAIGIGFPTFFPSSPKAYHTLVAVLLPILALNIWASMMGAVFSSLLAAHDRFDLARGLDLCVLVVRTAGTVAALLLGYGIAGLVPVTVACSLIALAGNYVIAKRLYPALRTWPPVFSRARLRELFGYGIASAVSTISYRIVGQTDLILVGALIAVSSVTVYSVGAMVVYYSWGFLMQIDRTFFPPVQRAAARGDVEAVRWYYLRQIRMSLLFGIPIYIGFSVFGHPFIRLWMEDKSFPEASVTQAALVMGVLSASKFVYLLSIGGEPLLQACGRIRLMATLAVIEALTNLGLSVFFVLVMGWGLVGVAAGTLVSRVLVRTFIVPWQAARTVRLRAPRFFGVVASGLLGGGAFAALCLAVRYLVPADSWLMFALQVGFVLAAYAPIGWFVLVPRDDRNRILRAIGVVSGSAS